jgi:protein gp37
MAKPLGKSGIPWCDYGWGVVEGCTKCSPGCEHCYAQAMLRRFRKPLTPTLFPDRLDQPAHTKKPGTVFVCPMGDLFHEDVPFAFSTEVMRTARAYRDSVFVVLTKRPERMQTAGLCVGDPVPHVWLGVSVSTQAEADKHLPILARSAEQGWNTWVSVEPLLEEVRLPRGWMWHGQMAGPPIGEPYKLKTDQLVIVGCESGPGARPFQDDWARSLRDQCAAACVPFYFKQRPAWGELQCDVCEGKGWTIYAASAKPPPHACANCRGSGLTPWGRRGKVEHLPLLDGVRHDALPWEVGP